MKHQWVIQAGANPSTDFFILPVLSSHAVTLNTSELPPPCPKDSKITLIFVRYINKAWVSWIELNNNKIENIIYFMDDDLFDLNTHKELSFRYRWKLFNNAYRFKRWLKKNNAQLWVSTSWLANKYTDWQPKVLIAHYPYHNYPIQKTIFYHGSASHSKEAAWLLPIIREVLEVDSSLVFEIIGDKSIRKLFSKLPRVNVLHPMSWQAYKALISRPGRAIGLAPLLENDFNSSRSYTKFFDITQAQAVGIYSDHSVYHSNIKHNVNGLLLAMDQDLWVSNILMLSHSIDVRDRMLKNAQESL